MINHKVSIVLFPSCRFDAFFVCVYQFYFSSSMNECFIVAFGYLFLSFIYFLFMDITDSVKPPEIAWPAVNRRKIAWIHSHTCQDTCALTFDLLGTLSTPFPTEWFQILHFLSLFSPFPFKSKPQQNVCFKYLRLTGRLSDRSSRVAKFFLYAGELYNSTHQSHQLASDIMGTRRRT